MLGAGLLIEAMGTMTIGSSESLDQEGSRYEHKSRNSTWGWRGWKLPSLPKFMIQDQHLHHHHPAFFKQVLHVCGKPVHISLLAMFLLLSLIFISTSYYLRFTIPISRCSESVAALPLHRSFISSNQAAVQKICVVIVVGDDSSLPSFSALPYVTLRRLFQRVFKVAGINEEVGMVEADLKEVLVRVDYTSLVCKMVRDALGPAAKCESFLQMSSSRQRVNCETLVVGQTKKYVQQACGEWTDRISYKKLEIVDLDAPDPAYQPPLLPAWRPTVVTAFSRNHFKYGLLLLRSLANAASNPTVSKKYSVSMVAWTMDEFNEVEKKYLDCVIQEVKEVGVEAEVRRFPFENYPPWMRLNASLIANHDGGKGEYAWKAIMAHTILQERGFILWVDAGGRILTPEALTSSLDWVKKVGFGGHKSEDTVKKWTYPTQLKFFRADTPYIKNQRNCDASRMGFTLDSYKKLIRPWYECSITRQCIAPEGSDRLNHRQDQAALSVLSYLTSLYCVGLSNDLIRHTDNYGTDFYGGVKETKCYTDPINL